MANKLLAKIKKLAGVKNDRAAAKLKGKTVAFVGKFGYRDMNLARLKGFVAADGGKVVKLESSVPDYLITGEGRGGSPPAIVAKVQKQHPNVQILDEADFCRLLLPSRDELLAEIRSGPRDDRRWEQLEEMFGTSGTTVDLAGVDLRKANLYGAHLEHVNLDGADLRGVTGRFTHFPTLRSVKLDEADLSSVYLLGAQDCSFHNANMTEVWLVNTRAFGQPMHYPSCDFSGAKLVKARGGDTQAPDGNFREADLTESELGESSFERADFSAAILVQASLIKSNFTGAKLTGANLTRADLREALLVNADLRRCNLSDAVLIGADLTGAVIDGADFTGANLSGAKIDGLDSSEAKNFQPRSKRTPGSNMRELAKVAATSKSLTTTVELDIGPGETVVLYANGRLGYGKKFHAEAGSSHCRGQQMYGSMERADAPTFEEGMVNAAERWAIGKLRLDSVTAKGSKCQLGRTQLLELATAAWSEAFGLDLASTEALHQKKSEHEAERASLRETMLAELRGGATGIKKWNARLPKEREKIGKLRKLDFSGAKLSGALLDHRDLQGSSFDGANLKGSNLENCQLEKANFTKADLAGASLQYSKCPNASFEGANLAKCKLSGSVFRNANFRSADLTKAEIHFSDQRGADFTDAVLEKVDFLQNPFDDKTRFPSGFVIPETLVWKGPGPHPSAAKLAIPTAKPGSMDFEAFFQQLSDKIEAARLSKATAMLKAERFQLFADVKDDSLLGVVKSQSNTELVYSCRLGSDGKFGCCTQNLNPCGGLRGALCKHLLVLVVGLTKAGDLDAATVDAWVNASKVQKPEIDKDVMSATFLRYKGAEAGEIDWRPTETIPEDYYAM
ncbi:MAG TPA: pentapeptide repeat-containing protein [Gemmataceae bacterium]|nr:pentapeptide repeat-containing protein [Gemmataceae bacterium]